MNINTYELVLDNDTKHGSFRLMDHIIVGSEGYMSFHETGLLWAALQDNRHINYFNYGGF